MEQKIRDVVEEIKKSKHIDEEDKPAIIAKIEEWKKEKAAVSDLMNRLEGWWLKLEPIFAEIGLI